MAQRIFFSYKDEDSTFDLSRQLNGMIDSGMYGGFDWVPQNSMQFRMNHAATGKTETQLDKTTSPKFGVIKTKQGVVVRDDSTINITIDVTAGTGRTDLIVLQHEYTAVEGGSPAIYLVIKGTGGLVEPPLTNPNIQVPIGRLYLPPNTDSLTDAGVTFTRFVMPTLNGMVQQDGGQILSDLNANGNNIVNLPIKDFPVVGPILKPNAGDALSYGTFRDIMKLMFPKTIITAYTGAIASIPAPWKLCDGTNGSPDLRGKFIVGSTTARNSGSTGGAETSVISQANLPAINTGAAGAHNHQIGVNVFRSSWPAGPVVLPEQVGTGVGTLMVGQVDPADGSSQEVVYGGIPMLLSTDHTHSLGGSGTAMNNMPPYYALCYVYADMDTLLG